MGLAILRETLARNPRWTASRKEDLVRQIKAGEVTAAEVRAEFSLTDEELSSWVERYERHGRRGLEVRMQQAAR